MRVSELDISAATFSCLLAVGITEVEHLTARSADDLLDIPHLGATELYEIVCQLSEPGLIVPPIPWGKIRPSDKRNREILRLRIIDGLTFVEIGRRVNLSKERVRQILRWNYGLRIQPPAVGARRRRETIERIWAS